MLVPISSLLAEKSRSTKLCPCDSTNTNLKICPNSFSPIFQEIRPTNLSQNQKQQTQSDFFPRRSFEIRYIEMLPYRQL